jgi:hypothetical protein
MIVKVQRRRAAIIEGDGAKAFCIGDADVSFFKIGEGRVDEGMAQAFARNDGAARACALSEGFSQQLTGQRA